MGGLFFHCWRERTARCGFVGLLCGRWPGAPRRVKKGRTGELDRTAQHSTLSTLHSPTPRRLANLLLPPHHISVPTRLLARSSSSCCCCHGGPSDAHALARHVHRLRRGVLRVQVGREPGGDAEGHRLRLRQGRRLHADHLQRAMLQPGLRRRALLLRLQQLLPEVRRHGRHLRLHRRRHTHRGRPQRRILQVPGLRQRRRHRNWRWHRHRHRDGHRNDPGSWDGYWNWHRHRSGHWCRHWDGNRNRRGDGPSRLDQHRDAGQPVRRGLRPVRQHEPGLQPRGRSPRSLRRRCPRRCSRAAVLPPLLNEPTRVRWLACRKGRGRRRIRWARREDAVAFCPVRLFRRFDRWIGGGSTSVYYYY